MRRYISVIIALLVAMLLLVGCAKKGNPANSPVTCEPGRSFHTFDPLDIWHIFGGTMPQPVQEAQAVYDERYQLWGEWTWYIPASHDRVDVVPRRAGRVHVNVLKWLEEDCADCLEITNIKNNGDSTIDLTVRIRHPKPGHAEFTGFDVKGILMFNGSYEMFSLENYLPYPEPFRMSWREVGDAEVLNADGYTMRWCPSYNSGSSLPLLSYWPGKYSNGTPTANINAYLNFYTTEDRHMFTHYGVVTRVYHIYLPPGPLVAGYAVEACWVPPDKTPVTDPENDFPMSANQSEPYFCRLVINNDEPVFQSSCCGNYTDCSTLRVDVLQWGDFTINSMLSCTPDPWFNCQYHVLFKFCESPYPENSFICDPIGVSGYPDGNYRGWAIIYYHWVLPDWTSVREDIAYTIVDFTVDND